MKINSSTGIVLLLTIGLMTASVFSLGCAEQETPAEPNETTGGEPAEPVEPVEPAEPVETIPEGAEPEGAEQAELGPISVDDITDIEWQWTELQEFDPTGQSVVPDPENYTLVFTPNDTYSIKADCNVGSGSYTLEGNTLTLGAGPMTLAECGPESLYDQYVTLLSGVNSAAMEDGQLVLYTGDKGDRMFFANGGPAEV
ncbi:META domain-containing protein [Methanosarcina sp. KYL-1]|uniref:META domain-containing protein n=1 Tax=Methanosarcina sp. KYL-1 TaxID=2602068 RepID=UPI0021015A33|nr:META domain-containing protein [Methanosarcina sp. KYL-1]MCQ1536160.1 META domain-containing protein [Methanosarcina sp. KYL-1]